MKVYNCGAISSLAAQKLNDRVKQCTSAIHGNMEEGVELRCFVSSGHIGHNYI